MPRHPVKPYPTVIVEVYQRVEQKSFVTADEAHDYLDTVADLQDNGILPAELTARIIPLVS
ncbi:hypothetical protein [uncultured Friedmanniella sp.]|uniref:hypothetical protein n=1 Tax=uncultured Friedmanniella sp. TaxID=335381 RepID=UPI0035CACEA6